MRLLLISLVACDLQTLSPRSKKRRFIACLPHLRAFAAP